jgi:hypothetical protein
MIGYRDRTWCPFWASCAKAHLCSRPLTEEVREAARNWWGSEDAPIIQFAEKPDCHDTLEVAPS